MLEFFLCLFCVRFCGFINPGNVGRKEKAPAKSGHEDTSPTLRYDRKNWFPKASWRYFRGRTESFMALPTRNFSVVLAGIWMVSPVAGLRPSRAFLSDRTSLPNPGSTNSPFDLTSLVA